MAAGLDCCVFIAPPVGQVLVAAEQLLPLVHVPVRDYHFPDGFLGGAATAGHQVEGNNVNSDVWLLEHVPRTIFAGPSGDACDHSHLYPHDIATPAGLGLNTYRFSVEWARIEPAEGEFSRAMLEHYRRVLVTCHEHGLTPVVTFNHFVSPRWLLAAGG